MRKWNCVAIVGVGLIGGSVGLAVRRRGLAARVVGYGRRAESLRAATDAGAVGETSQSLAGAVAAADLVVVCTPVGEIAAQVLEAAGNCPSGALLTDAGSTKGAIVAAVEAGLPPGARFVGSHPLAGSEKTGAGHASGDLFEGRVVVVTPTGKTPAIDVAEISEFWSALGAKVVTMSPEAHDEALATTSHMPHLVASAVARATINAELPLTAGGWRDLTRIAAGDPELWTQIFLENQTHILKSLERFEKTVFAFREALEQGDRRKLLQLLTEGKSVRDAVGN